MAMIRMLAETRPHNIDDTLRPREVELAQQTPTQQTPTQQTPTQQTPLAKIFSDDQGSLSILIFSLFLMLLLSAFVVVDSSDAYLAKRELVGVGEVAITRAAHQISLSRYYSGNVLMDTSIADGPQFRIPIDCNRALASFTNEISASNLRGMPIHIDSWSCVNDEVQSSISAVIPAAIRFPLGIGNSENQIASSVGAVSIIAGSR